MAPHSSTSTQEIPWTQGPSGLLQSMGSQWDTGRMSQTLASTPQQGAAL